MTKCFMVPVWDLKHRLAGFFVKSVTNSELSVVSVNMGSECVSATLLGVRVRHGLRDNAPTPVCEISAEAALFLTQEGSTLKHNCFLLKWTVLASMASADREVKIVRFWEHWELKQGVCILLPPVNQLT